MQASSILNWKASVFYDLEKLFLILLDADILNNPDRRFIPINLH